MPSFRRTLKLLLHICCLVILLTGWIGAAQGAAKNNVRRRELAATPALPSSWREDLLAAVNRERAMAGFGSLCTNDKLTAAAQKHSADMVANKYLGHTGSTGSTLATRIVAEAFKFSSAGENVAAGQQSVDAVMTAWMNSPGHTANILGNFTFFGAGVAQGASTTYGTYWTQVFGSGTSEFCACIVK